MSFPFPPIIATDSSINPNTFVPDWLSGRESTSLNLNRNHHAVDFSAQPSGKRDPDAKRPHAREQIVGAGQLEYGGMSETSS